MILAADKEIGIALVVVVSRIGIRKLFITFGESHAIFHSDNRKHENNKMKKMVFIAS